MIKPVIVTITAPSAAGKSHLLNHLKKQGYQCLVSTTTRAPRVGEVHGQDYYFISPAEADLLLERDGYAETEVYRGVRYGVTKLELNRKLCTGAAFLIVEPNGVSKYTSVAEKSGALHLKYFIFADMDTRLERMKKRLALDILLEFAHTPDVVESLVSMYVDRIKAMLTVEPEWFTQVEWTRVLSGKDDPEKNLQFILNDARSAVEKDLEISAFLSKPSIK